MSTAEKIIRAATNDPATINALMRAAQRMADKKGWTLDTAARHVVRTIDSMKASDA